MTKIKKKGKSKGQKQRKRKRKGKRVKKNNEAGASARGPRSDSGNDGSEENEENEEESEEDGDKGGWKPTKSRRYAAIRGMVKCNDGFAMSIQASSEHTCTPRDDVGPYRTVEVGYPNQLESLLMPFCDAPSLIVGAPPVLYVLVPAYTIRAVIEKHAGLRHDSYPLPDMDKNTWDRDEDGLPWAMQCLPPTSSDTDSDDSDYVRAVAAAVAAEEAAAAAISGSPHSTIHLGAPPPPPPPTTPLPPPPPTTPEMRLGELTPPQRLRDEEISPIERTI